MWKNALAGLVIGALLLTLAACSSSTSTTPPSASPVSEASPPAPGSPSPSPAPSPSPDLGKAFLAAVDPYNKALDADQAALGSSNLTAASAAAAKIADALEATDTALAAIPASGQVATDIHQFIADNSKLLVIYRTMASAKTPAAYAMAALSLPSAATASAGDANLVRTDLGLPAAK